VDKILVIISNPEENISRSNRELLAAGRILADQKSGQLVAGIFGTSVEESHAKETIFCGADKAYVSSDPLLAEENSEVTIQAVETLVQKLQPQTIIFIDKTSSREIAPRLAYRLKTGCVLDCVEIGVEKNTGRLLLTKPIYGGKAVALFSASQTPVVVILRTRTIDPAESDQNLPTNIENLALSLDSSRVRTRIIERVLEQSEGANLEDATTIISGGRGMGGPEPFQVLEHLAHLLKGSIGASRAACDLGWVPASWQIGQTGKKVAPQLYLAIGISGASQHLVGIAGAKHIVAINTDPNAPIFKVAELGVVEDYKNVVPHLIAEVKERQTN
jgi:electron transfer flavoprotein alpha subunit